MEQKAWKATAVCARNKDVKRRAERAEECGQEAAGRQGSRKAGAGGTRAQAGAPKKDAGTGRT